MDKLCAPGDDSIKTGKEEVEILAEDIVDAIGPMVLAAHSADARNGEGVALTDEVREVLEDAQSYVDFHVKDPDDGHLAVALSNRIDALLAAPAPKADALLDRLERVMDGYEDHPGIAPAPAAQADDALREEIGVHVLRALKSQAALQRAIQSINNGDVESAKTEIRRAMHANIEKAPTGQTDCLRSNVYKVAIDLQKLASDLPDRWLRNEFLGVAEQLVNLCQIPDIAQQSATLAECTCPSGNGSLRHPCPVHSGEPVAWLRDDGDDVITSAKKTSLELTNGLPGARVAGTYNTPLYRATPADAASEADKRDAERYQLIKRSGLILSGGYTKFDWPISPFGDQCDKYLDAVLQRERQQGAQSNG